MKSFTNIIFLLLFMAGLAVPGVIFYNRWANKKADEATTQVSGRNISTATIFTGFQDKTSSSSVETPRQTPAERPALSPAGVRGGGAGVLSSTASAREPGNAPAGVMVPVSTHSIGEAYFEPKSTRDPTITPAEYGKMKEDEEKQLAAERQRLAERRLKEKKAGGASRIKLQGIVGNNVIINGGVYAVGGVANGVKILKIGPNYIVGEYPKGKQFKMFTQ